jgi:GNAT superfamily N-acetyltransferase
LLFETQRGTLVGVLDGESKLSYRPPVGPAGVTIAAVGGAEGRRLITRLVARCSAASLGARLFLPEARVAGRDLVTMLVGPADGWAYLAMDDGRPVGLLNLARAGAGVVEAGVLVADRWQRRGVARALLRHALAHGPGSTTRPGTAVRVVVQADNAAALGMLRGLGLPRRLVAMAPGEYHFELRPACVRARTAG